MADFDRAGVTGLATVIDEVLTREARWFVDGPLPSTVVEWFTASPGAVPDRRHDIYDLEAARRGIGRKHRNGELVDVKVRVRDLGELPLAGRLAGRVEDWRKVSRITDPSHPRLREPVEVAKTLHTRRYELPDVHAGCEIEVAEIEAGGVTAWSLCLETFGDPTLRDSALRHGVERFTAEMPIPTDLDLGPTRSLSYPAWIARLGA